MSDEPVSAQQGQDEPARPDAHAPPADEPNPWAAAAVVLLLAGLGVVIAAMITTVALFGSHFAEGQLSYEGYRAIITRIEQDPGTAGGRLWIGLLTLGAAALLLMATGAGVRGLFVPRARKALAVFTIVLGGLCLACMLVSLLLLLFSR